LRPFGAPDVFDDCFERLKHSLSERQGIADD